MKQNLQNLKYGHFLEQIFINSLSEMDVTTTHAKI